MSRTTFLFLDFYFGLELSWVTFLLIHLTKLYRYKNICSVRAESSHCLPQPQFLENVLVSSYSHLLRETPSQ